jgi:hypothetical protein
LLAEGLHGVGQAGGGEDDGAWRRALGMGRPWREGECGGDQKEAAAHLERPVSLFPNGYIGRRAAMQSGGNAAEAKLYLFSLGAGLVVGAIYNLLQIHSAAPQDDRPGACLPSCRQTYCLF